ncbi:hypothetical protein [Kosmotoga sp. DU53]|uniref:hypothetical protein n=1 Tax=Kosmotoga sp. DU53 TaxID=1310160 RepID=UPI0007C4E5A2|nr:hypothetical protein [Kosmotoga sp. DU53]OAA23054.1 hypothetical protein DU53_03295 [Kosmotoga sp. DU53]
MIIKKRRVLSLNDLRILKEGQLIRFGVSNLNRFKDQLNMVGFSSRLEPGETVLPSPEFGPVSKRNAEGSYIIHRDRPMETVYRTVKWTWKQWAGRGKTIEVSDFVDVPYKRYPRTFIPPYSIELTLMITEKGEKYVVTPLLEYSMENKSMLIHAINLVLELFGECEILDDELKTILKPKIIRLNWEMLPPGKRPWEKLREEIDPFIKNAKKGNREVVLHRIEIINSYKPDFVAIGKAGFRGYIVFGFTMKNTFVLESIFTNNATYIFDSNWEELSKLTKAEILNENLQKARIIHFKGWDEKIDALLNES